MKVINRMATLGRPRKGKSEEAVIRGIAGVAVLAGGGQRLVSV